MQFKYPIHSNHAACGQDSYRKHSTHDLSIIFLLLFCVFMLYIGFTAQIKNMFTLTINIMFITYLLKKKDRNIIIFVHSICVDCSRRIFTYTKSHQSHITKDSDKFILLECYPSRKNKLNMQYKIKKLREHKLTGNPPRTIENPLLKSYSTN